MHGLFKDRESDVALTRGSAEVEEKLEHGVAV